MWQWQKQIQTHIPLEFLSLSSVPLLPLEEFHRAGEGSEEQGGDAEGEKEKGGHLFLSPPLFSPPLPPPPSPHLEQLPPPLRTGQAPCHGQQPSRPNWWPALSQSRESRVCPFGLRMTVKVTIKKRKSISEASLWVECRAV